MTLGIESSGVICKGNVTENFEMLPMELFDYLELGLITHREFVVFMRLYQLYNEDYGYAFPTIAQLSIMTGINGKETINNALRKLERVGLIKKEKVKGYNNNVYIVFKPLKRNLLEQLAPDMVQQFEEKKARVLRQADQDKVRLHHYKLSQEQEIQAPHIRPKSQ